MPYVLTYILYSLSMQSLSIKYPKTIYTFWKFNEADKKSLNTNISSSPSSTKGVGEAGVETIGILKILKKSKKYSQNLF